MDNIIAFDEQKLIDSWLEQERNGVKFPVDFESAWRIAGYSRKDSAKRYLPKRQEEKLFHVDVVKSTGRPLQRITLSCDGLKHLCLMANNEKGDTCRQYFIDAEKKWRLVQKHRPEVAEEIEILKLKSELAKTEMLKAKYENESLSLKNYVVNNLPKPKADRILGVTEVKEIEYRDRIIHDEQLINDGSTVTKAYLCKRYGFVSKTGNPSYKALNQFLSQAGADKNDHLWDSQITMRTDRQFKREHLELLDNAFEDSARQMYLGE